MKKLITVVLLLIIAGAAVWFYLDKSPGNLGDNEENKYSNQQLGFSINYPPAWRSEECTYEQYGIVSFGDTQEQMLLCNSDAPPLSYVNVNVIGLAFTLDEIVGLTEQNLDNFSSSSTTVDGVDGVTIVGTTKPTEGPGLPPGTNQVLTFVQRGERIYLISHWNLENEDYLQEYDQMLDSFKFI